MARRSARLASMSKAPKQQPTEAPNLSSVAERDDSPAEHAVHNMDAVAASRMPEPRTPGHSSPMKPPMSEMHPSKVHPTMGPPSSGLRLGFTDIKPKAKCDDSLPAVAQTTPSRVAPPSSPFTFSFTTRQTPSDLKLGPEAQRMMEELREDAARIKAELLAKREAEQTEEAMSNGRKIAPAKGKAGRFSAAHMAEFKKMDSIENHPSAFRAQLGRMTPLKAGVKRSQAKAELDEPEVVRITQPTPASTTSKAKTLATINEPVSAKRARQNLDDDASSKRPVSRDGSSIPAPKLPGSAIPRSKPSIASLMTPTKSSLARSASVKTPATGSLATSPSKATISGIPRSATTNNLSAVNTATEKEPTQHREIKSPVSRLDRVKAMLRGAKASATKTKSSLPLPSAFASKTPAPTRSEKQHSVLLPLTTPGRKLTKRVAFTPETQRAALAQNSPSPIKSSIPQAAKPRQVLGEVHYPSLDGIMAAEQQTETAEGDVSYPDLSASVKRPLPAPPKTFKTGSAEPSVPSEFTFRSDHTISFGSASKSFGSSPGQASVRAVRPSILPSEHMPGSFPRSTSTAPPPLAIVETSNSSPNKENEAPRSGNGNGNSVLLALPHGMTNKKRHRRVSTDEEEAEREAAERAAKKRRQEVVPEGDALLAPRLVAAAAGNGGGSGSVNGMGKRLGMSLSASPVRKTNNKMVGAGAGGGTPSPIKRGKGISLSRLNMLARPKMRK